jgi:ketosteroid isomerase-like protein
MSNFTPTKDPQHFPATFAKNFNTGNIETVLAGYTDDAVLNLGAGKLFRGHAQIRQALENLLAPGLPIKVEPRSHSVSGKTAIVLFDWNIDGAAPDGSAVSMKGSAADVLQCDADGSWRQLLDYPFGSATPAG